MASKFHRFFEYMKIIGQLKQVKRTGWVNNKIKDPESVAEHMYRMAMIAFALPPDSGLDRDKCIKMALVHDMAESVVGDLTPWCGVSKEEKNKKEQEATAHIASLVSGEKEIYQLWLEYETQSSEEAKFVKDLDKFEMLFQAFEYEEHEKGPASLQEFYNHTKEKYKFTTELVKNWSGELESVRNATIESSSKAEKRPSAAIQRTHDPSSSSPKKRKLGIDKEIR